MCYRFLLLALLMMSLTPSDRLTVDGCILGIGTGLGVFSPDVPAAFAALLFERDLAMLDTNIGPATQSWSG